MDTNVFPGGADKVKSYWNRPGGKFGTIVGLGALVAIGYYVFPFLTEVVWNTINFGIAVAVAIALYLLLSNKKLWRGLMYMYEILIKKFVGLVIEMDPFIIAEDYIQDIIKEREKLYDKTVEVEGQKEALVAKIKEREREKKRCMLKAVEAEKIGDNMAVGNMTRQVSRLNLAIEQLTPIKDNLTKIGDYLTKVHKNSKYMLEDMQNDLELKKDLYKAVTKGNGALQSALKIFNGDAEKKLMVEQSMDFLKDDIATKLASMKKAISYSGDFMKSIDLDNAAYSAEGLQMLEEFKPEIFNFKGENAKPMPVNTYAVNSTADYDKLLS